MTKDDKKVKILTEKLEEETGRKVILNESKERNYIIGSDNFHIPPDGDAKSIINIFTDYAKQCGAIDVKVSRLKKKNIQGSIIYDVVVAFELSNKEGFKKLQKFNHQNIWRKLEKDGKHFHGGLENLSLISKTYNFDELLKKRVGVLTLRKLQLP